MNWRRVCAATLTSAAFLSAGFALGDAATKGSPTAAPQAKRLERGKYLTTICGCNDCHTPGTFFGAPDFSRQLSGSDLGWQGPWGVSFARNLTPDRETGIGRWSEADITKAIRSGVRPDGSILLPPMPWQSFSAMSEEDAAAVAAFLKSLPPISHKSPDDIPPGQAATGSILILPAPPAWDVPKAPPVNDTMKPGATGTRL
jgi:mono/diheme cytochrome c family protein